MNNILEQYDKNSELQKAQLLANLKSIIKFSKNLIDEEMENLNEIQDKHFSGLMFKKLHILSITIISLENLIEIYDQAFINNIDNFDNFNNLYDECSNLANKLNNLTNKTQIKNKDNDELQNKVC